MKIGEKEIEHILAHAVDAVIDRRHLEKALRSGKRLRVKLGIDPTSSELHLGHSVVLRKLKEFQDLGHRIVFIIGDFTATIGDPSGRNKSRPSLSLSQVKKNMRNYLRQAGRILNIKKTEVHYNSTWLKNLNLEKLIRLLSHLTTQQLIERRDFKERLSHKSPLGIHELLYPVFQAYDSIAVKADVECGGSDQLFNLILGRTLMEKLGMKPQDILTTPLLLGIDGKNKMSKSLRNYIALEDAADTMFGKIMSIPDKLVAQYFLYCTGLTKEEFLEFKKKLSARDLKLRLAYEIVSLYHGDQEAKEADFRFRELFSKKEISPKTIKNIPAIRLGKTGKKAIDIVLKTGAVKSKSEAKRLIEQGGFRINKSKVQDPFEYITPSKGAIIKIGKHTFFRVI